MKIMSFLFCLLISTISLAQSLRDLGYDLVSDQVESQIKTLLLHVTGPENIEMQIDLIQKIAESTEFYLIFSDEKMKTFFHKKLQEKGLSSKKLFFRESVYSDCMTSWAQDSYVRLIDFSGRPVLAAAFDKNLYLNECKPFEAGLVDLLSKPPFNVQKPPLKFFHRYRVDRKNGDLLGDSPSYSNLPKADYFTLMYGEGGKRIATPDYLFLDAQTWQEYLKYIAPAGAHFSSEQQARQYVEEKIGRNLIVIETTFEGNFYSYHLDMFLTPVRTGPGQTTVYLGHPAEFERLLKPTALQRVTGYDPKSFAKKILQANSIERQLMSLGLRVKRIPLYFTELNQIGPAVVTFNNVLQTQTKKGEPLLLMPSYQDRELGFDQVLIMKHITRTLSEDGIQVEFIRGGGAQMGQNGQLRCLSAVLR
jgi:hypothetical protein